MNWQTIGWGIVATLFVTSGFFSGSETALMAANRLRLQDLAEKGDRRAIRALALLDDAGSLLSAILLGNNFANILMASLATALATEMFGPAAPIYVSVVLTVTVLIFAEIIPKTFAAGRSLTMSLVVSSPLYFFLRVTSPIVRGISTFAQLLLRPLMKSGSGESDVAASDIVAVAEAAHEAGAIEGMTREMVRGVYDFTTAQVRDVMVNRRKIESVAKEEGIDGVKELVKRRGHTRIPIWGANEEDILGIVHAKDLLQRAGTPEPMSIDEILRPALFLPESTPLTTALRRIQASKSPMAFVVDEYGGLEGLATIEDILEELVGDITDEHDTETGRRVNVIREGTVIADANVSLGYLRRKTDIMFKDVRSRTLSGLLVEEAAKDLRPGTSVEVDGKRLTVLATDGRFLKKVRIDVLDISSVDGEPASAVDASRQATGP